MSEKKKGRKNSEEQNKKISEAMKGEKHPLYGKHHTEESKRKMSEKKKGQIPGNIKKVICITTGKKFDSITEASNWYNVARNTISFCCKGKRNYAGKLNGIKLQWKYEEDDGNESKAV